MLADEINCKCNCNWDLPSCPLPAACYQPLAADVGTAPVVY